MHYLTEAFLFLPIPLLLIVLGWWTASAKNTRLENSLLMLGALPAAFALLAWLQGSAFGLSFAVAPLLLLALCLLLPVGVPVNERMENVKTQGAAARRFVGVPFFCCARCAARRDACFAIALASLVVDFSGKRTARLLTYQTVRLWAQHLRA